MTALQNFSAASHMLLALVSVWFLLFRFVREYRVDALRDSLFAVREKLFDYAADGNISFSDPAYTRLRMLINSLIRFAHRLTFTRFLMGIAFQSIKNSPYDREVLDDWEKAVEALPQQSQLTIRAIHQETLVLVVRHLVVGSPLMWIGLFAFVVWSSLTGRSNPASI